jgi:hypothetical protein
MITEDKYLQLCAQIKTPNASKFLRDFGWIPFEYNDDRNYVSLQKTIDGDIQQIDFPNNPNFHDYPFMMLRACQKISEITGKTISEVISDLLDPMADIVRFRRSGADINNGSIPIESAVSFFEGTKKTLAAAAMDLTSPRSYRKRMKMSQPVDSFIKSCRFGQTEFGSYIISLVCPLEDYLEENGRFQQLSIFGDASVASQCFTRKVVNKTIESIKIIKTTIDQGTDLVTLANPSSPSFVSGNFMENLHEMTGDSQDASLDIGVQWAPLVKENRADLPKIAISSIYRDALASAVDSLKNQETRESTTITGLIVDLKGEGAIADREKNGGLIKVVYVNQADTSRISTIYATLEYEDYQNAVEAHRQGKTVRVTGVVLNNQKMENPEFEVL